VGRRCARPSKGIRPSTIWYIITATAYTSSARAGTLPGARFRRAVAGVPDRPAPRVRVRGAGTRARGDAEVEQLDVAARGDEHIARLDVAVDQAGACSQA
jgi:hypothetical protein